ncbi:MAG: DNA polymerase III subunit alpha [Desulfobaccales bacterium]
MPPSEFVHLHVHTAYSLLDGAVRIQDLLAQAQAYEMPAVAITDHGTLFGVLDFYQKARAAGIKPILGCELYVAPGSRQDRKGKADHHHLVVLAENNQGYQNLIRLVTRAHLEGFYYRPRVDQELLQELGGGLIAMSACLHGKVAQRLLEDDPKGAEAAAREYAELFPGRFYLEVQANGLPEQLKVNQALLSLAPRWGIPLVATNDVHYLRPEDARAQDVLLCIQTGKTVNTAGRMKFQTDQLYFKSPAEMAQAIPNPAALAAAGEIAARCDVTLDLGHYRFPVYPAAHGQSMESLLSERAREGLQARLAASPAVERRQPEEAYWQRLEYETDILVKMGFAGYFLVVADIIAYARHQQIPVGPGRGSAAGSLAAYSLGITDLDPLAYGLFFERFLNPERMSPPDIDVDFCYERRGEIIDYVSRTYGWQNVAQITTFGSMKTRQVIRDVGRALEVPYPEVDRVAKLVPERLNITLEASLQMEPRLRELRDTNPTVREVLAIAAVLEGLPRHASTHASAVVIADRPLIDYLPLYKGNKGELVTQFDMKGVEKVGLVKFDFLGLRTLTVIDQAVGLIQRQHQADFDIHTIPLDDAATFQLLQAANTAGVFQLESAGIRALMVRLRPTAFEDIIALVALYRPGPMESGMHDDYVRRKHGEAKVDYILTQLEPILKETYGVILYQEQVMQIAAVVSGFSLAEADLLRRAMGKKDPAVMEAQRHRFLSGAAGRDIPKAKAQELFNLIEKFAGYGFNKSHSAAYALVAYQTAYLKAHYPLEFLAAVLNSEINNTAALARHIMEARDEGIELLPPDINKSSRDFTVAEDKVRYGLAGVKNVGLGAIQEILEARGPGRFESFRDFLERISLSKVNHKVLESLIQAGAFDALQLRRSRLMAGLDQALEKAQNLKRLQDTKQMSMFAGLAVSHNDDEWLPEAEPWEKSVKLAREKEALGVYLSGHPLDAYRSQLKVRAKVTTADLAEIPDSQEVNLGVVVTSLKEKVGKKGGHLAILTVEDLAGSVEVLVFGEVYERAASWLKEPSLPLWLKGAVLQEEQGTKLRALEIAPLEAALTRWPERLDLQVQAASVTPEQLLKLKEVLGRHPGPVPAFLHFLDAREEAVLALPPDLGLSPSAELAEEVNRLLGYPALSL